MSEEANPRLNREQVRAAKKQGMVLPKIKVKYRDDRELDVTISVSTMAKWEREWQRSHVDLTVQDENWRMDWVLWLVWCELFIDKADPPVYNTWMVEVLSIDWDAPEEDAEPEAEDGHPLEDGEEAPTTE